MKHYVLDGNNLIGKSKELSTLQNKDKQLARERLAFQLSNYFHGKKYKVTLHFDGHKNVSINAPGIKIVYSENKEADASIRRQIELAKNPKLLTIISSDREIQNFAKACSCEIISSEDFDKILKKKNSGDDENKRIESLNKSNEEFKRLFGLTD